MNGGGLDPRYNLSYIVSESVRNGNPIIAASIQYRLSNWGWMFSRELAGVGAGNLGLRDQRLALHWVQENIGAFGGDATKVTIWGESAGAFSVGYHLVAYGGRDDGLFRSGILQSGSPAMKSTTVADWQPYFDAVVRKVGCAQTENVLDCLKRLPWTTLNDVFNSTTFSPRVPGIGAVLDGDIIVDQSSSLLRQGRFVRVPVLMGINTDEGASFAPRGINTEEQFLSFVRILGANATVLGQITKLYPDDPDLGLPATLSGRPEAAPLGLQWKRAVAFYGDVLFHSGRRLMAEVYAKAGVPVFSYRFNVLVNGAQPHQGSSHFKEVAFVFHNIHGNGYDLPGNAPNPFRGKGPEYTQLANIMSNMWSSFVATGDPNTSQNIAETQITDHESPSQKLEMAYDMLNHEAIAHKSKLKWPMYTLDTPVNIVFDVNVTDLTYIEADEFRKEAISLVNDVWHP